MLTVDLFGQLPGINRPSSLTFWGQNPHSLQPCDRLTELKIIAVTGQLCPNLAHCWLELLFGKCSIPLSQIDSHENNGQFLREVKRLNLRDSNGSG